MALVVVGEVFRAVRFCQFQFEIETFLGQEQIRQHAHTHSTVRASKRVGTMASLLGFSKYCWRFLLTGFGIAFAADGMEMYLLALILPFLPSSWDLTTVTKGMLGGGVFVGMSFGAPAIGYLGDRSGRMPAMRYSALVALATASSTAQRTGPGRGRRRTGRRGARRLASRGACVRARRRRSSEQDVACHSRAACLPVCRVEG